MAKVEEMLHMVGGTGETSYATNSRLQERVILRTKAIVEEAIGRVYKTLKPKSMVIADLGCSSGPNTFLVLNQVINVFKKQYYNCCELEINDYELPEIQFVLNDLPGNDFNSLFKCYCDYEEKIKHGNMLPYYISAVAGSFYGRLFPSRSIHFFHSSYSIHWLSQIPEGQEKYKDIALVNRGNIYISHTSPTEVVKIYQEQYLRDFSTFLRARSVELCNEGIIVLTFIGRRISHPAYAEITHLWLLLAEALNDMVYVGILPEEKLDSFNMPYYIPSMEEVKTVIHAEGSFELDRTHIFESNWDPSDDCLDDIVINSTISGINASNCIRAVVEPMIISHFKIEDINIVNEIFSRYAEKLSGHLQCQKTKYCNFTIVLKPFQTF